MRFRPWMLAFVLAGLVCSGSSAKACSIPVFRYALERWEPDFYGAIVFHRGPLEGEAKAAVDWLTKCAAGQDLACNLEVRQVDLAAEKPDPLAKLWTAHGSPELPWMLVLYPQSSGIEADVWAGPPTAAVAKALVDSPARRKVVQALTKGDAAVWVFLESGDKAKDEAAAKLVAEQLKKMAAEIELPEPDPAWGEEQPAQEGQEGQEEQEAQPAPKAQEGQEAQPAQQAKPKVAFPLVRLSRADAAEAMLVHMLLNSEPDLKTLAEPMVFPVFGRGRALCAFVGKGINEDNLWDAGGFMCGACSCQVKAMNPGTDLLMVAAWEAALDGQETPQPVLPPLVGVPAAPIEAAAATSAPRPSTLAPRPSTLDPRPSTLDPRPSTLDPRPSSLVRVQQPAAQHPARRGGGRRGGGRGRARAREKEPRRRLIAPDP